MSSSAARDEVSELEQRTIRKVMWRLVPFLVFCYFVAYLDRVNVGFAKLQMNAALGLSDTAFAFGAGIFFWAYFLLEVPSNLALNRFGARLWIARIMFTWGLVSGACAFIPWISAATGISNPVVFYILRFMLGLCEAGFYPGIIFFLTLWFPTVYRARVVALFMLAIPMSTIIGGPISGALLDVRGMGLDGWQWLYVLEAVPSLVMAIGVVFYLTDRPAMAKWLHKDEAGFLEQRLDAERQAQVAAGAGHHGILKAIFDPRVFACAFVYFCLNAASYGVSFFLPTIIKGFGASNFETGLLSALPFICGAIGMVTLSRWSDRTLKRQQFLAFSLLLAAVGVGFSGLMPTSALVLAMLCVGQFGISSVPPLFWPIPSTFMIGASSAAAIAAINSLGNLSGYFGPQIMGYLKDQTGTFTAGLMVLGGFALVGAVVAMMLKTSITERPVSGEPIFVD